MEHRSNFDPSLPPQPSRLMLGLAAVLFVPIFAAGLWGMMVEVPAPRNLGEWLGKLLIEELLLSGLVFFTLGFVWAVFKPAWLERGLHLLAKKVIWLLLPLSLQIIGIVVWIRLRG